MAKVERFTTAPQNTTWTRPRSLHAPQGQTATLVLRDEPRSNRYGQRHEMFDVQVIIVVGGFLWDLLAAHADYLVRSCIHYRFMMFHLLASIIPSGV